MDNLIHEVLWEGFLARVRDSDAVYRAGLVRGRFATPPWGRYLSGVGLSESAVRRTRRTSRRQTLIKGELMHQLSLARNAIWRRSSTQYHLACGWFLTPTWLRVLQDHDVLVRERLRERLRATAHSYLRARAQKAVFALLRTDARTGSEVSGRARDAFRRMDTGPEMRALMNDYLVAALQKRRDVHDDLWSGLADDVEASANLTIPPWESYLKGAGLDMSWHDWLDGNRRAPSAPPAGPPGPASRTRRPPGAPAAPPRPSP